MRSVVIVVPILSRKVESTRAAISISAGEANSSGLWLTPPRQRTNSMANGMILSNAMASWPAPLGIRRGVVPQALGGGRQLIRKPLVAMRRRRLIVADGNRCVTPRRCAIVAMVALMSSTAFVRSGSDGLRISRVKRTRPGMVLAADRGTSSLPTVATRLGRDSRPLLDGEQHFGRRGQRILAHRHRHSAGMAGDAVDLDSCRG